MIESGEDFGASLAVNIDGEMVVDLWGGLGERDPHRAMESEHDHQRVLDHENDDRSRRA